MMVKKITVSSGLSLFGKFVAIEYVFVPACYIYFKYTLSYYLPHWKLCVSGCGIYHLLYCMNLPCVSTFIK